MILSITDGIEVTEHTEPEERALFMAEFLRLTELPWHNPIGPRLALLSRQAE